MLKYKILPCFVEFENDKSLTYPLDKLSTNGQNYQTLELRIKDLFSILVSYTFYNVIRELSVIMRTETGF